MLEGLLINYILDNELYYSLKNVPTNLNIFGPSSNGGARVVLNGSKAQTALSYVALILADSNIPLGQENVEILLQSANLSVDRKMMNAFVEAMRCIDTNQIVNSMNSASNSTSQNTIETTTEAVTEEVAVKSDTESSDGSMGFGLFD